MVTGLETQRENLVAVQVSGSLHKHDYEWLIPLLEGKIKQFGKVDLYWEMADLEGWHLDGLWEDLKFDVKHINDFGKIALVGDKKWEAWIATMIKPFTTAKIHYFDLSQKDAAMAWLNG